MWDDVGCWCLRCRELAVNGTDAMLQIDRGGDDFFVYFLSCCGPLFGMDGWMFWA